MGVRGCGGRCTIELPSTPHTSTYLHQAKKLELNLCTIWISLLKISVNKLRLRYGCRDRG